MNKKNIHLIELLLFLTLIVTCFNVFQFFSEKANFQYSDWLINYQAGFIRRGFIGEIFFKISNLFKFRLDVLMLFFVFTLYITFYYNFYKIIKKINFKIIDWFIILSPISFFYTAFEQKASGRKDIIFLSLFSLFIVLIKRVPPKFQVYLMVLFTTITSLTHSGLIFYNIYFLVLFICFNYRLGIKKTIVLSVPFILSTLVILFLISSNSTISEFELDKLCKSIIEYLPNCGQGDYISTLTWGLQNNIEGNRHLWFSLNYVIFYLFSFIFCLGALLHASNKSKIYGFNFFYVIFSCFISTLPLYIIGADYGRYLHISYISSILIYYFLLSERIFARKSYFINFNKIIIIPILVIYSFTFTVPFCCKTMPKFNYIKLID